nr:MAG TPA: hypothetical protein [Caudoviricetes sp.]
MRITYEDDMNEEDILRKKDEEERVRRERTMENKTLSKMTEKEILRQQLELLAERSKKCEDASLSGITNSMISIYSVLLPRDSSVL